MESLNIMINKYIELRVIEKVNDEIKILELTNNIKNEIYILMPNELIEIHHEYRDKITDIIKKIKKYENIIINYHQKVENKSILLSVYFYSVLQEIDDLKDIKRIYQEVLLYIKEVKRQRRIDSILRLTKKI